MFLEYIEISLIGLLFDHWEKYIRECEKEQANGVIFFDVATEKPIARNLNDFNETFKKSFPVTWEYFCFVVHDCEEKCFCKDIENGEYSEIDFDTFCQHLRQEKNELDWGPIKNFNFPLNEDSDSEEDGEICFHCQ